MQQKDQKEIFLHYILKQAKPVFIIVFSFSFVVNLFMLITPLYSLQVLDRVLSAKSLETLFFLTLLMLAVYVGLTLMQIARSFTLIKLGEWLDKKLSPECFAISIRNSALKAAAGATQNLRDLQAVKAFLTSAGINTIFDAPWSIMYIIVLFVIHPWMGWLSIIGAILILIFAVINAYAINKTLSDSTEYNIKSMNQSDIANRNAEVIEAMGMMNSIVANWHQYNQKALEYQSVASYRNGVISNFSKYMVRMVLQMLVTGIGAYLVIKSDSSGLNAPEMSVGGMIASSIMLGRALAPFDSAIEVWKQVTTTLKSYKKLELAFQDRSGRHDSVTLPTPEGKITVENVYFAPPSIRPSQPGETPAYTLKGVNFDIEPGEALAIIGPSAAGKSSLVKIMVGVWKANQGYVRLDGADVYSWNRDDFGHHVGYLPQDVELFNGTIQENIARFRENTTSEEVIEAAQMTGAHDMILRLRDGYETDIGIGGANLSGGQRQRVGLARAFLGNPKLVILDEPNASLDEKGEQALVNAIENSKKRKITTVVVSHRPSILSSVDKILILQEGAVAAFGPRDEILARFSKKPVNKSN